MERRESKRLSVSFDAELIAGENTYSVFIGNLSETGLHVFISLPPESASNFEKHPSVKLTIKVEPIGKLNLSCKKLWSNELSGSPLVRKIGLLIVNPPEEYKKIYKTLFYKERTEITKQPIAVVGMACYYPGAPTVKHLWENILARRREFRRIPDVRLPLDQYYDPDPAAIDKTYGTRAAIIDGFEFDWIKRGIPKTVVESSDISHWLALETALRSLEDAGYGPSRVPPDRSGVILGNTLTGEYSRAESMRLRWPYVLKTLKAAAEDIGLSPKTIIAMATNMEAYYKSVFAPVTEDTLAGNLSNTIAGRICNFLNLKGGGYTVDGACSSSLIAVATAATALSHGNLDLAVAGGVDISLDTFELIGFAKTKALTQDDMRVYDRRASGFIPGEGTGFVVLKRLEDARADGDQIYAVIRGWAISSDGKGGLTAPKAATQALAIRRAYTGTGYGVADLDFVEGHGTGTAVGDVAELKGIAQAMGDRAETDIRPCGITSLKSIIGHTKAASGIGGFIKTVMAVNRRVLPPTANCIEPNHTFEKEARSIYPILQGEIRANNENLKAGISSMGFGGINCHVTIESGDTPFSKLAPTLNERQLLASGQETELFVISASSKAKLLDRIQTLQMQAKGMSIGELVDFAAKCAQENEKAGPWRAAVIAQTPEALLDNLQQLNIRLRENPPAKGEKFIGPRMDVFLSHGMQHCKVGFLFPGQGSQQLNMGKTLIDRHEWARTFISNVSNWLNDTNSKDAVKAIYKPLDKALGQPQIHEWAATLLETEIAQPAICVASLLWVKELKRLGIIPFAVGGHSLGELVAFQVAGALNEETLLKLAALRGQLMAAPGKERGSMASLGCSFEKVSKIIEKVKGYVVAANINGPRQVVISGDQQAVEDAVGIAQNQQIDSRLIKVSNAFHSKFVAGAAEQLRQNTQIQEFLGAAKIKLFTGMGGGEVKRGTNLRQHFADQIVSQVDFQSLVKNMALECDLLLEVGPGNATSSLAQTVVGMSGPPCLPIESKPGRDRDYNTFLAHFFVLGGKWQWNALYKNRLARPFVLAQDRNFIINPCERPIGKVNVQPLNGLSIQPTVLHKNLIADSGIDPQVLAAYLEQRSSFLSSVIKADIEKRPLKLKSKKESTSERKGHSKIANTEEQSLVKDKKNPKDKETITDMFLDIIENRTGFPRDSLSVDMRLLDNLNIDSIKSADMIGQLAINLDINGEINVFPYANATIKEIIDAFESVHNGKKEHTSSVFNGNVQHHPTWVRNMVVKNTRKSLHKKQIKADEWRKAKILMYIGPQEQRYALALGNQLSAMGAELTMLEDCPEATLEVDAMKEIDDLIAFLPSESCAPDIDKNDLLNIVSRLQRIADPAYFENSRIRSVTFVQFGGGHFGVKPPIAGINQCSAVSFAASLHFERLDLKTRVLDFDKRIPAEDLAEKVLLENQVAAKFIVAGYDKNLIRRVPMPTLQNPTNYSPRTLKWDSKDVFLVTGGGKGISAECAFALAQKTGVRMALVGSSPLPENINEEACSDEIVLTLKRYKTAGLEACYYQCDVVDPVAVTKLIEKITSSQGKITGVIHGSARNNPKGLQSTTADEAFFEVAPKIMGAINLSNALKNSPPRLFIGFTSIIGISGMIRNGWYAFSNEALHLILCRFRQEHNEAEVLSIAFSLWDEIGMGFRLGGTKFLTKMGIDTIPVKEGINRFLDLVSHDPHGSQIIITARLPEMDTLMLKKYPLPSKARFLENIVFYFPGVEIIARTRLTLEKDSYARDHVWRGTYLFPTVFGLEAMAEAVAYLTGNNKFNILRIENVQLGRPIVVNPEKGTGIEIHAIIEEPRTIPGHNRIQVGISTEQTDYSIDFFSATFILSDEEYSNPEKNEIQYNNLAIINSDHLYNGKFLFQGPKFQRIRYIYELDSKKCIFDSLRKSKYSKDNYKKWLLDDPFFMDSLLQSAQLPALQFTGLPVSIKRINIFGSKNSKDDFLICKTVISHIDDGEVSCEISSFDQDGNVVGLIDGYTLKIMEYHKDYPTPEDLVSPEKRDEEIIKGELKRGTELSGYVAPQLAIAALSGHEKMTKEQRHRLEEPALKKAIELCLGAKKRENIRIAWLPSGKPIAKGEAFSGYDISLSNDLYTALATAGQGLQGCDLQSVTARTRKKWATLLGKRRMPLLDELISYSDSIDQAGTRIWAAVEAGAKATGSKDISLNITLQEGKNVFFEMTDPGSEKIVILTFPVSLTLGPERIVAVTVKPIKNINAPLQQKSIRYCAIRR